MLAACFLVITHASTKSTSLVNLHCLTFQNMTWLAMVAQFTEKASSLIYQLLNMSLRWKHINPEVNVIVAGGNQRSC